MKTHTFKKKKKKWLFFNQGKLVQIKANDIKTLVYKMI